MKYISVLTLLLAFSCYASIQVTGPVALKSNESKSIKVSCDQSVSVSFFDANGNDTDHIIAAGLEEGKTITSGSFKISCSPSCEPGIYYIELKSTPSKSQNPGKPSSTIHERVLVKVTVSKAEKLSHHKQA